jgi:RHS repeat-associated protein
MRTPSSLLFPVLLVGASCSGQITGSQGRKGYSSLDTSSNQKGRLTSSGNSDARTVVQYDALGRAVATEHDYEDKQFVFQTAFGYPQGSPPGPGTVETRSVLPDGEAIQYGYDAGGAQTLITAGGQPIVKGVQRNARGQTVEVRYGDDTVTRHGYRDTSDLRLDTLTTTSASGTIQSYHYEFDPVGNIKRVDDYCDQAQTSVCGTLSGAYSAAFGYDSPDPLTATTNGVGVCQGGCTYGYDAVGNLTNHAGVPQTYPSPGNARPHAPIASQGERFDYDADGNMTATSGGLGVTWNAENMAAELARPGQERIKKSFRGEAVWKKVEEGHTTYYLPSVRVEDGGLRKFFGSFAERAPDGTLRFYHGDHLGSSTLVTDAAGTIVHRAAYLPYGGEAAPPAGNFTPRYQFNFKEKEASWYGQGLYDYGARLYNPATGRWLSADTSAADGLNRYAYVRNNPTASLDPTGHETVWSRAWQSIKDVAWGVTRVVGSMEAQYDWAANGMSEAGRMTADNDDKIMANDARLIANGNGYVQAGAGLAGLVVAAAPFIHVAIGSLGSSRVPVAVEPEAPVEEGPPGRPLFRGTGRLFPAIQKEGGFYPPSKPKPGQSLEDRVRFHASDHNSKDSTFVSATPNAAQAAQWAVIKGGTVFIIIPPASAKIISTNDVLGIDSNHAEETERLLERIPLRWIYGTRDAVFAPDRRKGFQYIFTGDFRPNPLFGR